ncbi:TrlF family AAA-like ATPase [Serratia fonticola]|uniref:TrlF family AAA-like ATPase n=1 Tax=Serratia fonticola TaxID=47917 RepID=UPI000E0FA88B|nr:hypothetical protein [Serratia fonticola]RDL20458.1 putative metal-dependent phosphoesterase TrpH [Serratia fonticola]
MESRGSEWHKWDLHVHTPASVLKSEYGDDWDRYVRDLFNTAIENNVSAIGLTDYYFIDGYKKIRNEYLNNPDKMISILGEDVYKKSKDILILPNIEFRLDKLVIGKERDLKWNRKINYHLLLCNTLDPDVIEREIINRLTFDFCVEPGGRTDQRVFSRENLEEFGRKLIKDQASFSGHSPLFVGMINSCVNLDSLTDILSGAGKFKNKYIFGLPVDEDLSQLSWTSQGHAIRKNLIKKSHVIFSSNDSTIDFCKGLKHPDKMAFINEFGALKPCVWGSDAHESNRLFLPDNNKFTWIKSDLSFDGLKQIVYEPATRVRIQEASPQNKTNYQTIKRVRFLHGKSKFSSDWIYLSRDLNTIIGGKSSGKSLLMYFIATAINNDEVINKLGLVNGSRYSEVGLDFEVEWDDGSISLLSDIDDSKPITYIPQLYINKLAEDSGRTQLKKLIEEILSQHNDYKDFIDRKKLEINSLDKKIKDKIDLHQDFKDSFNNKKDEMNKIGVRDSVSIEIKRLEDAIKVLRERSGFKVEDTLHFNKLNLQFRNVKNRMDILNRYKENTESFIEEVLNKTNSYVVGLKAEITSSQGLTDSGYFINRYYSILENGINRICSDVIALKNSRLSRIPKLINVLEIKKQGIESALTPYIEKFKEKSILELNMKSLSVEQKKIMQIDAIQKQINKIIGEAKANIELLKASYSNLMQCYRDIVIELSNPKYDISGDMQLIPKISFSNGGFNRFVNNYDLRGNISLLMGDSYDSRSGFNFNDETHIQTINDIYTNTKKDNIPKLKSGITEKDVMYTLYDNYFYIDYEVMYKNDEILQMSPGKRGMVLLNILLHLSNSTHPIFIDQPEDNLDNRTIYEQLNEFVRERKLTRQVILVTHNANLVVSADAECVIVANQSGQINNGENEKYQFEYTFGCLENSFEKISGKPLLTSMGIRQHVCDILEGGQDAFREREVKYGLKH